MKTILPAVLYFLSLSIYLHPLILSPTPSQRPNSNNKWSLITHPQPQLDELHILDPSNTDVNPIGASWKEAWHNDYWGRPLNSTSSHKSWRPVSVWSFRFGKCQSNWCRMFVGAMASSVGQSVDGLLGMFGWATTTVTAHADTSRSETVLASELFIHRFANVLLHTCLVQLVGVVALLLFPNQTTTCYLAQLLFCIHPTHVESVANAANRPHLLGLLFNVTTVDPSFPLLGVSMCYVLALLSAETALFQLPAIIVTMTAIRYKELIDDECNEKKPLPKQTSSQKEEKDDDIKEAHQSILTQTIISLLPRYAILIFTTTIYLIYRLFNSSLSIPLGLIRPAENPFYAKVDSWSFTRRMVNYAYITSLHVMKSLGVEIVGMSHEYGYDCIPEMKVGVIDGIPVVDLRLGLPILLLLAGVGLTRYCWYGGELRPTRATMSTRKDKSQKLQERTRRMLLLLVFFAWMATLFPIAGILKVGTFVADRIIVPSTVGTCIFGGKVLATWIFRRDQSNIPPTSLPIFRMHRATKTIFVLAVCAKHLVVRTHKRTADWMDSVSLLESSLRACPRSIKSNLEMSKLYSGLVPHMQDFEKALTFIETAQSIDPTYCDVHQQFGHVYFQQGLYIPFENAMVQSLMCPFTMGQAMTNWKRYWNAVLTPHNGATDVEARKRYNNYMKTIEESIEREARQEAFERRAREAGDVRTVTDEL